jgi:hypothetical protein
MERARVDVILEVVSGFQFNRSHVRFPSPWGLFHLAG